MAVERRQALDALLRQSIYFRKKWMLCFFERKRVMYCLSRPMLSRLLVFIFMKFLILSKSIRERLTIVCEEEPRKPVLVRGHFKVVNGRKVYVKTHYR